MNNQELPQGEKKVELSPEEKAIKDLQKELAEIWEEGQLLVERFASFSKLLPTIKSDPRFSPIFDKRTSGIKRASIVIRKLLGF